MIEVRLKRWAKSALCCLDFCAVWVVLELGEVQAPNELTFHLCVFIYVCLGKELTTMPGSTCRTGKPVCSSRLLKSVYLGLALGVLIMTMTFWLDLWFGPSLRRSYTLRESPDKLLPRENCSSPDFQEKVPLLAVGGTHTRMVSAYLEHRYRRYG